MKEKLVQQLARIFHKSLFQGVLDVRKVYASLDWAWCMDILKGYDLGPKLRRIPQRLWTEQAVVPKSGRFYAQPFSTGRGVTQVYPVSPTVFNIMVDAVVKAVIIEVYGMHEASNGIGWAAEKQNIVYMRMTVGSRAETQYG